MTSSQIKVTHTRRTSEEIRAELVGEIRERLEFAGNPPEIVEDALKLVQYIIGGEG